jgi:undecaprenyl diphosphate synthase
MIQSSLHVALIMDGNGRWALRRNLPRLAGHHAGERALRRIIESAPPLGIQTLTVYAFSSDNWKRPAAEVRGLMLLLETHMARCIELSLRAGVRVTAIGRRDRLPAGARAAIEVAEHETRNGTTMHLRVAIDYSSRDALLHAFRNAGPAIDQAAIDSQLGSDPVDLLIRTGGEQRLSDFLLWECAYAELLFTPCLWPDFGPDELRAAIQIFRKRDRRYGAIPAEPSIIPPSCSEAGTGDVRLQGRGESAP